MDKKVIITGIGMVSSVGIGKEAFKNALFNGISGIHRVSLFDASDLKSKLAGEIGNLDFNYYLDNQDLKYLSRATKLLLVASKLALKDANILVQNKSEMGIVIGTVFGSLSSAVQFVRVNRIEGPDCVSPMLFPDGLSNSPASQLAIHYGIRGLNITLCSGFAASSDALGYATHLIKERRAGVILVGGVEELYQQMYQGFYNLRLLSGCQNGQEVCAPFDKRRNGMILGEGVAVLLLEDSEYARNRGANAVAEVIGYGSSFGNNLDMLKETMLMSMEDAHLKPEDIDYICANANGSIRQDRLELEAIKKIFYSKKLFISSIKSIIGECYSASGLLQCIAACLSIQHNMIPPTVDFEEADLKLGLLNIQNVKVKRQVKVAMINSFGCDGNNSCLIIKAYHNN